MVFLFLWPITAQSENWRINGIPAHLTNHSAEWELKNVWYSYSSHQSQHRVRTEAKEWLVFLCIWPITAQSENWRMSGIPTHLINHSTEWELKNEWYSYSSDQSKHRVRTEEWLVFLLIWLITAQSENWRINCIPTHTPLARHFHNIWFFS